MELATTFEISSTKVAKWTRRASAEKGVYFMPFLEFELKRKKWLATPLN